MGYSASLSLPAAPGWVGSLRRKAAVETSSRFPATAALVYSAACTMSE